MDHNEAFFLVTRKEKFRNCQNLVPENPVISKHRGSWAELIASAFLLEQGFDVFQNVSSRGLIDLIAVNMLTRQTHFFDVKLVLPSFGEKGNAKVSFVGLSDEQVALGVALLFVSPDGICSFDRHEMKKKLEAIYTV